MRRSILPVVACLTFLATGPAAAQTAQVISLQGSILGAGFVSDEFEAVGVEFGPGAGFEGQVRYNPSAFSVGVGFQYTIHPVTVTGAEEVDVTVDFAGLFVEPRYVIFVGSETAAPYVAARLMRLVSTLRIPDISYEEPFDALGYNIGGGLLIRAGSRMNLDLGLTVGAISYVYEDPTLENETGSSAVFRIGLALGL